MSGRRIAICTLAASLALSTVSLAPALAGARPMSAFPETQQATREAVDDLLKATGATSISVALVDGSRTVWTTTGGAIDSAGTAPSPTTLYGVGSVSKMLTAVAVMQLVDAGKVSLDSPVADYVTDFRMASPEYRQITVRMLLDHSAGLPGTDYSNAITSVPFAGYAQQMLDTLAVSHLKTTPGAMSVYCNDCFTLAGILVERMSGLPFTDYVTQRILAPLGMNRSTFATAPLVPGTYAPVLTESGALPGELLNISASGGLKSTPAEMGRLAAMLLNGGALDGVRILSPKAVAAMGRGQLPTTLTAGTPMFRYGLGWDSVAEPGLAAAGVVGWEKGGDTPQYHAAFTLAPTDGVAVVVLAAGTTVTSNAVEALAQRIVLSALVEKGDLAALPEPLSAQAPRAVAPTAAQTADIAGIYLSQGTAVRVTPGAKGAVQLALYAGGEWATQPGTLTLRRDGQYWPDGGVQSALGLTRGWGRTYLTITKPGGAGTYRETLVLGQKVTSVDGLSPAWQQRLGETWLIANERADSALWQVLPTITLAELPGLTGYLWVADELAPAPVDPRPSDETASMFLTVPILQGRDLNDLQVLKRADGEWLRFGGPLYRPLSSVPSLVAGPSDVTIGPEGYVEWRTVPSGGTVTVSGPGSWKIFTVDGTPAGSGDANGAAVALPAGARMALFGAADANLRVSLTPSR